MDSSYSSALLLTDKNKDQGKEKLTWHQMFTNAPSDHINFFHNSFKGKEIPTYLTIGTLTGTFMLIDQQGCKYNNFLFKKSTAVHNISNIMVNVGDEKYQFLAAALFAIHGIALHDRVALKTASNIAEAVISTGLCVQILKRMTGRQSPSASSENGGDWDPFPSFKQYKKNQPGILFFSIRASFYGNCGSYCSCK